MVNSSLAYEILLYLNSFYFGMFAACEIGMGVLKAINLTYKPNDLKLDGSILITVLILETIRTYFGRKGSLSEHGWEVFTSIGLTVPCAMGVYYLLLLQSRVLQLERILSGIMLILQLIELFFAWQVITSVFLTIPCAMGVYYLLMLQAKILELEKILCALMLLLQITELIFAILFLFSMCRPVTYT